MVVYFPFVFTKKVAFGKLPVANHVINSSLRKMSLLGETVYVYDSLRLNTLGLSREAYDHAIKGFNYLLTSKKIKNDKIISIIDFSLSSGSKRLYIIYLKNYKILYNTYVAHGRNSGKDFAKQFSNENESFKTSLGFYITKNSYIVNHGYSLRLQGEEKELMTMQTFVQL